MMRIPQVILWWSVEAPIKKHPNWKPSGGVVGRAGTEINTFGSLHLGVKNFISSKKFYKLRIYCIIGHRVNSRVWHCIKFHNSLKFRFSSFKNPVGFTVDETGQLLHAGIDCWQLGWLRQVWCTWPLLYELSLETTVGDSTKWATSLFSND